jgi:phenylalanyl-tRNA synthetase beta chain
VIFELELPALLVTPFPAYAEVSRFPAVIRDLALVVPQSQALAPLLARGCRRRRRPSCGM